MGYVAVEDSYGCIDREALEVAAQAPDRETLFAPYVLSARLTERGQELALDIRIACAPGSLECRRRLRPGREGEVWLETAPVSPSECGSVHELVLTQAEIYLEGLPPWTLPAQGPSLALTLAASAGSGPLALRGSLGGTWSAPSASRWRPGLGLRAHPDRGRAAGVFAA